MQILKDQRKSHLSCEEITDQLEENTSIKYTNNDNIDKGNSENYETHTYASVDVKRKKSEDIKIQECNHPQEVCTINYPDRDGGTSPPVPPHTPEMLLKDSDSNTRHDERASKDQ